MVPARLGTISNGSVNMTKACQHRAELRCAGPAHFDKESWHRTRSAQHLLTCQCKLYRAKSVLQSCCAKYWASVFQSQKRVTAISQLCSCIPCVYVPSRSWQVQFQSNDLANLLWFLAFISRVRDVSCSLIYHTKIVSKVSLTSGLIHVAEQLL